MATTEASSFFGYAKILEVKAANLIFLFFLLQYQQEASCEEVAEVRAPLPSLPGNQSLLQIHCQGSGIIFMKVRTQHYAKIPPLKGISTVFVALISNMGYGQYF